MSTFFYHREACALNDGIDVGQLDSGEVEAGLVDRRIPFWPCDVISILYIM
jgi:hypothetical protein